MEISLGGGGNKYLDMTHNHNLDCEYHSKDLIEFLKILNLKLLGPERSSKQIQLLISNEIETTWTCSDPRKHSPCITNILDISTKPTLFCSPPCSYQISQILTSIIIDEISVFFYVPYILFLACFTSDTINNVRAFAGYIFSSDVTVTSVCTSDPSRMI